VSVYVLIKHRLSLYKQIKPVTTLRTIISQPLDGLA
jgi:hypothetical protein